MRFWFFVMAFMSVTAFGNQLSWSEEHYRQIEEDFARGSVPTFEQLNSVSWRAGRCIYQHNASILHGSAIGSVFKRVHGPYYGDYAHYFYIVHNVHNFNGFDALSAGDFQEIVEESNDYLVGVHPRPTSLKLETMDSYAIYLRFFGDTLLASIEKDSKREGMCYYFREVTE